MENHLWEGDFAPGNHKDLSTYIATIITKVE
jgi:hypothetical protein